MKLTGRCKEDFEDWLDDLEYPPFNGLCEYNSYDRGFSIDFIEIDDLDPSMKFGIYVDFFDSVGINIWTYTSDNEIWGVSMLTEGRYLRNIKAINRNDARTKAIEKANELYNALNKS